MLQWRIVKWNSAREAQSAPPVVRGDALGPSARRTALTHLIATLVLTGKPSVAAERVSTGAGGKPASPVVLLLGDSWSAEYGLRRGKGWVALLEQRLSERPEFKAFTLVNASVSGETTAGGLSRLPALLEKHQPRVLLIALGGNDGLRGLSLENARTQLSTMIDRGKASGAQVLLIGMRLPPNYGGYAKDFEALFPTLARQKNVPLVPFLMAGIEEDVTRFQADRIHPNESAQAHMLDQAWPAIEQLLRRSTRK